MVKKIVLEGLVEREGHRIKIGEDDILDVLEKFEGKVVEVTILVG